MKRKPVMEYNFFGNKIREARRKIRYQQKEIAELMGQTQSNYALYEYGKAYPTEANMKLLAEALQVPLEMLKAWEIISRYGEATVLLACQELKAS